jgi:hypothetical protein
LLQQGNNPAATGNANYYVEYNYWKHFGGVDTIFRYGKSSLTF